MCPICQRECRRETLEDGFLCGDSGFSYTHDATGRIVLIETNRTTPPKPYVQIVDRVKWTLSDVARVKSG